MAEAHPCDWQLRWQWKKCHDFGSVSLGNLVKLYACFPLEGKQKICIRIATAIQRLAFHLSLSSPPHLLLSLFLREEVKRGGGCFLPLGRINYMGKLNYDISIPPS